MNSIRAHASPADPSLRLRVTSRTLTAENIVVFELQAEDGMPLPEFTAGAHLEVDCNGLARHYSLCSDPSDPFRYSIAVQFEPSGRGGSRYLFDNTKVGDILITSLPRNHFALQQNAGNSVGVGRAMLIGGGIGITPLLAMAWSLYQSSCPFQLHYFASSPEKQAFKEQLAETPWSGCVTRHIGRCEDFCPIVGPYKNGTHLYVCGPFQMIDAVLDTARTMGWPDSNLHCERFAAPSSTSADADLLSRVDTAFEVELARSGRRIAIAADRSVCAALLEAGVIVPMSCEQGVCGSCLTRVIAGTPDHRDYILTADEQAANDQFTPCCSRSHSPLLVLDL